MYNRDGMRQDNTWTRPRFYKNSQTHLKPIYLKIETCLIRGGAGWVPKKIRSIVIPT